MDAAIAQVAAITGTTPEIAAQYAQLADGDVNQAVQLYFENDGADLAGGASAASAPPPATTAQSSGGAQNPINLDDDDNISDDNDPAITGFRKSPPGQSSSQPLQSNYEDDEAMARRLQEEMYGGVGSEGGGIDEPIRAPIARQSETLLGPGTDALPLTGSAYEAAMQSRLAAFNRRRNEPPPGIFNQNQPTSIWDRDNETNERNLLSESTAGASEASSRSNRLARLFQPPWDLMYKGEWESARDEGKEHKKWLLVDIQDPSIFDCQALNRDLWKNEGIVDTVKENFVFIQYNKNDPRASQYIQYYFPAYESTDEYPHVAIVDPRTGEQIKLWSRKMPSAAEFLMQLHEFLDRYSLENNARNPVAKRKPEAREKPFEQLTEEEQIERALQASLATQATELKPPTTEDPDDLTRSIGDLRSAGPSAPGGDAMDVDTAPSPIAEESSAFSAIPSDKPHSEPAMGEGVTRIQFRHTGGRIVRRFGIVDKVQQIYEWLKAEPIAGMEGKDFDLVASGQNLLEKLHETIEQAGLKNGTVMIDYGS